MQLYSYNGTTLDAIDPTSSTYSDVIRPAWSMNLAADITIFVFDHVGVVVQGSVANFGLADGTTHDITAIDIDTSGVTISSRLICLTRVTNVPTRTITRARLRLTLAYRARKNE